jgi:predicted unusual protein kinase regulating ubiquinone biosynthesis (AarF/ABC1/UbiB family)
MKKAKRIVSGRWGRTWRISRLVARLSASWLGAWFRRLFASKERRRRLDAAQRKANAERVTETLGQMKGIMMKLGQMASFVSDDLPEEYRTALSALQADAPPMDFALVRDVVERELGRPLERAFARFDQKPLASASIGQVHRARLPSGEDVVVKVQYPGVAEAIQGDLANAAVMYRMVALMWPSLEPGPIIKELTTHFTEEVDYLLEADNQRRFYDLYRDHPFIRIPRVWAHYSTARVLTTEYVEGLRFADILEQDQAARSRWGEILYRFVFGSIFRHGVFNGDPHPGNYIFGADGRMTFLDFGLVKRFPPEIRQGWPALLTAHLTGDRAAFRELLARLDFVKAEAAVDTELLYRYFAVFYDSFREDRTFVYTRGGSAERFRLVFKPPPEFLPVAKSANMPPDFVWVNRIQWGVESILGQLQAARNWHRILRELLYGDPPSTELGVLDATCPNRSEAA